MVVCAGESEQFAFATPIGIGLVDSAIQLTQHCLASRPKSLLFVGTAGSYGEHQIFDILTASCATNIENSFFTQQSYTPIANRVESIEAPRGDVSRETIINSSNYITTDATLCKCYLDEGIGAENMEFFAVLKVAKQLGIPAHGLFIVTNYCNQEAHQAFVSHHQEAMERLTHYAQQYYGL